MTESQLTLFAEDSPAKTSVSRVNKKASRPKGLASGVRSPDLLARYDLNTRLWKTSQHSFLETEGDGLEGYSEIWPRSGMMRSGIAYELPTLAHPTKETESGLWPTPTAMTGGQGVAPSHLNGKHGWNLGASVQDSMSENPSRMWPTPTANEDAAGTPNGKMQKMLGNNPDVRLDSEGNLIPGTLNPTWVEWLMGFPLEHTDLNA